MNILKKISIIIFIFLLCSSCASQNKSKSFFYSIEKEFSIPIEYINIEKKFPEYWLKEPINAKVEVLNLESNENLSKIKKALKDALNSYPSKVLNNNLKSIGIANKLFFYGTFYGATYTQTFQKNSIYLSAKSTEDNIDVYHYVLDSFHHEFSSILMKKYPFPETNWRKENPSNFVYHYENKDSPGLEALKNNISTSNSEQLNLKGFLSEYSMSSIEEDVNVYSGVIFSYPEWILSLGKKNPPIEKKLKIWLKYYLSIDPDFSDTKLFKYFKDNKII